MVDSPEPHSKPLSGRRLRLSVILADLAADGDQLTLGDIIDRTTHAGFGFLLGLLALVAVPFVGLSLPFGLAIAFGGVQMMIGRDRPWLPARLRRHAVTAKTLEWMGTRLTRWTGGMERWISPRLVILTRGPFWGLIGAGMIFQGIGLALPLPIPASNWIFIIGVLIYAIGMLEDDGALILVGHAVTATEAVLCVVFWKLIQTQVAALIAWISS